MRLKGKDDVNTVLAVNGATLTDNYWVKSSDSLATYEEIRFKNNLFDKLALCGNPDSYSLKPARTPELTSIGSFEKCWRLINGKWWLYKKSNDNEIFSELFISKLSERLQLPTARYEKDGDYIRTLDFTDGAKVNYEPIYSLVGEYDDYQYCFDTLLKLSIVHDVIEKEERLKIYSKKAFARMLLNLLYLRLIDYEMGKE